MDNAGLVHFSSQIKFLQRTEKWDCGDQTEDITVKPDAFELACLLKAIGFKLREFEKREDSNGPNQPKNDSLKVIIECGSSKIRAVMELDDITSQCSDPGDAKDAFFWNVDSTAGPLESTENMNKVADTGSNLLPSISKGDAIVVRNVTQQLLKLIKNIPDANQNTDSDLNLGPQNWRMSVSRWHTQPDFNTGITYRSLDTDNQKDEIENAKTNSSSPLLPQDLPMPQDCSSSDSKPELREEIETEDLMAFSPGTPRASRRARLLRQDTFDIPPPKTLFKKPTSPRNTSSSRISLAGNDTILDSRCSLIPRLAASSLGKNSSDRLMKSPVSRKTTPTNNERSLLQKRSIGRPVFAPKSSGLKIDTPRPGTSENSTNSSKSKIMISTKQRVSSANTKESLSNASSSQKNYLVSDHDKLQSNIAVSKNLRGGAAAISFGFIKNKV